MCIRDRSGDYTSENIRFTQKGDTVFAIQLGWPGSGKRLQIKSLGRLSLIDRMITHVSVVDSPESIQWELEDDALLITAPSVAPNKFAICYRIETTSL